MTVVLKLGGSLITEKDEQGVIDHDGLRVVAEQIGSAAVEDLIVIHGGGSFGHPIAAEYGLTRTSGSRDPTAVREIGRAMAQLSDAVVTALDVAGCRPFAVSPRGSVVKEDTGDISIAPNVLDVLLEEGFVPVLHGDIAVHRGAGCSIVGGDELAVAVSEALAADRIGLCANVPGVLDADGTIIPRVQEFDHVADLLEAPKGTDVTGGIGWKIEALLATEIPSAIFGRDALDRFLAGDLPGTRVGTEPDTQQADSDSF